MHELKACLLNVFKSNDRSFHEGIIRDRFKWERATKKGNFFGQSFPSKKSLKKRFLDRFFFEKFACGAENLVKIGSLW